MATTKEKQEQKKISTLSSPKSKQRKAEDSETDLSQKSSSNVGKGPAGENL